MERLLLSSIEAHECDDNIIWYGNVMVRTRKNHGVISVIKKGHHRHMMRHESGW